MSVQTLDLKIKINFPLILIITFFLHALLLSYKNFPIQFKFPKLTEERSPLIIKDIRTVGAKDSRVKDSAYVAKTPSTSSKIDPRKYAPTPTRDKLSLTDLSVPSPAVRPGTRPTTPKAISAIKLKGSEIQNFAQSGGMNAARASGDPRARSLNNSDILVNLEVPEGVHPDELNKYELMFYGFQRRTAILYINSFYTNLDRFQRENPHLQFPMTNSKQIMTGRLTYDEKGNVKQIKMIRWSNEDKLQNFFENVLKGMDTLHNPPEALWSKTGEFSIFFSLVING